MTSGFKILQWYYNWKEAHDNKLQNKIKKHNDEILEEYHRQYLWAYTEPMRYGIQEMWTYKCAYCGTTIMGTGLFLSQKCLRCGAGLVDKEKNNDTII